MSSDQTKEKTIEDTEPTNESFYRLHRNDSMFKYKHSKNDNDFHNALLLGKVKYFEFTQDCNGMGRTYIRCYYKLIGDDTVYQQVPLDTPQFSWSNETTLTHATKHKTTWEYIKLNYVRQTAPFQLRCYLISTDENKQ